MRARLNVAHTLPQVVQESGTGTIVVSCGAEASQQVGIDKISRHFIQPERQLLGSDFFAQQARLQHASIAVVVQLSQAAPCVHAYLISRDPFAYGFPIQAQRVDSIRSAEYSHL